MPKNPSTHRHWVADLKAPCVNALFAGWVSLIMGCSPPAEGPEQLQDYQQRLSRTLETAVPDPVGVLIPPRLQDADITPMDIPSGQLNLLDFLALSDCALQVNIGRRNSSLGRNAAPSQRLLLDLEFLALAPACVKTLERQAETNLANTLTAAITTKTQFLPHRIFNAVLAGPEYRQFWQFPTGLDNYPSAVGGDILDALHWFEYATAQWLAGNFQFQTDQLEQRLYHLRAGDGGALLLAAVTQARSLQRSNHLLTLRLAAGPLCPNGRSSTQAKTLETVVVKYFATGVQAWLADLNRRERQLISPIENLEAQLATILPLSYRQWKDKRLAALILLRNTPREHIASLQHLAESCSDSVLGIPTQR
ncbi:MAG: DUF3080 family protein [Luminiphilus sp.]|nr:DUF3080 family protein [Luminiphilus sp.]